MNCVEFRARLHPYVDGELTVSDTGAADAHRATCPDCARMTDAEREFRALLRRQPREVAPPELRARIIAHIRRRARWSVRAPWLVAPAVAGASVALVLSVLLPGMRTSPALITELVDKHIAYAQLERPAELASTDRVEVAAWFRQRAALRVIVPDYSASGIRLVGARLADANERQAAYLLYEKGRTLLSVFMVPVSARDTELRGTRLSYRGEDYVTHERKGYRTVSWTDGHTLFGLVSTLDYDALLECADRLRFEHTNQTRL
jgi:mycothiol system anti-sigma-R factor